MDQIQSSKIYVKHIPPLFLYLITRILNHYECGTVTLCNAGNIILVRLETKSLDATHRVSFLVNTIQLIIASMEVDANIDS